MTKVDYERDILLWRRRRDEAARERVVKGIWNMVYHHARKLSDSYRRSGYCIEKDDIAGACWPKILEAIDSKWNPQKGSFTTYIGWVIRTHSRRHCLADRTIPLPISISTEEEGQMANRTRCSRFGDIEAEGVASGRRRDLGGVDEYLLRHGGGSEPSVEQEVVERVAAVQLLDAAIQTTRIDPNSRRSRITRMTLQGVPQSVIEQETGVKNRNFNTLLMQTADLVREKGRRDAEKVGLSFE